MERLVLSVKRFIWIKNLINDYSADPGVFEKSQQLPQYSRHGPAKIPDETLKLNTIMQRHIDGVMNMDP
jgi:hypothetical protein